MGRLRSDLPETTELRGRVQVSAKVSVRTAANISAWVSWYSQGCLLRFTDRTAMQGQSGPSAAMAPHNSHCPCSYLAVRRRYERFRR